MESGRNRTQATLAGDAQTSALTSTAPFLLPKLQSFRNDDGISKDTVESKRNLYFTFAFFNCLELLISIKCFSFNTNE